MFDQEDNYINVSMYHVAVTVPFNFPLITGFFDNEVLDIHHQWF